LAIHSVNLSLVKCIRLDKRTRLIIYWPYSEDSFSHLLFVSSRKKDLKMLKCLQLCAQ
jgi:hypothetical protein